MSKHNYIYFVSDGITDEHLGFYSDEGLAYEKAKKYINETLSSNSIVELYHEYILFDINYALTNALFGTTEQIEAILAGTNNTCVIDEGKENRLVHLGEKYNININRQLYYCDGDCFIDYKTFLPKQLEAIYYDSIKRCWEDDPTSTNPTFALHYITIQRYIIDEL